MSNKHEAGLIYAAVTCAGQSGQEVHVAEAAGYFKQKIPNHSGCLGKSLPRSNILQVVICYNRLSSQAAIKIAHTIFISFRSDSDRTQRAFHHATAPAPKVM